MRHRTRFVATAQLIAKGMAIGAANIVPGVSGGTIAVVTGIYDRLVAAIGRFFSRDWKSHLALIVPVLLGAVLGIAGFARVVDWGLTNFPEPTFFVFVGLIAGSLPFLISEVRGAPFRWFFPVIGCVACGLLILQGLAGAPSAGEPITIVSAGTILPLIGAGVLATATMVIPGVSGSFVLLLVGMYATFLDAVRSGNLPVLAVLAAGAAVGLVVAALGMSTLLERAKGATLWLILGLVVGSIFGIWPGISSWGMAAIDLVAAGCGYCLAILLGKRPSDAAISPDGGAT